MYDYVEAFNLKFKIIIFLLILYTLFYYFIIVSICHKLRIQNTVFIQLNSVTLVPSMDQHGRAFNYVKALSIDLNA